MMGGYGSPEHEAWLIEMEVEDERMAGFRDYREEGWDVGFADPEPDPDPLDLIGPVHGPDYPDDEPDPDEEWPDPLTAADERMAAEDSLKYEDDI